MSRALLDALAAHGMGVADFRQAVEDCIDQDVNERPPQSGQHYKAFAVYPRKPGPTTLAIGHREGEMRVVDLLRDGLTVAQAAELTKAYGINTITGAENDEDDTALHAIAGLINLLQELP